MVIGPKGPFYLGLLIGCALLGQSGYFGGSSSALADARRVRATQVGGTLGDYLDLVTAETHSLHQAEVPYDERPMVALKVDYEPHILRSRLATHLELTWTSPRAGKHGYLLQVSPANKRERDAARVRAATKARRELLAQIEVVRRMSYLPPEKLKKLALEGDNRASAMLHPRDLPMVRLAFSLPQRMWQELWDKGSSETRFSLLSKEQQDLGKLAAGDSLSGGENLPQTRDSDQIPNGRISLRSGGTFDRPTVWVCLKYGLNGSDFNLCYAEGWTREPPLVRRRKARQNPSRIPDDARFREKVTLRDKPRKGYFGPGERPSNALPLAEYLEQLSNQVGVPVFAECDYRPKDANWLYQQWWLASDIVERPLTEALDMLCADFEFEWRFRDGALFLRPTRWYLPPEQQGYKFPKWK